MSKQSKNIEVLGSNVSQTQNVTPNIHIAFKLWIKNHNEYKNLVFTHGERLFMRDLDGVYVIQVSRLLFEVFEMAHKRGVTYRKLTRARIELLKHAVTGAFVGAFLTGILFKALGVY